MTCCQLQLGVVLAATIGQPTATSTPISIPSTSQPSTTSATASATNTTHLSQGLSSGVRVSVGAAGGVLAIIIVVGTLLFWNKRRAKPGLYEPVTPISPV